MIMKTVLIFLCMLYSISSRAQTATNWTVTDCAGVNHELFADLDAGKVAVIVWVMPCSFCIDESLAAQSAVQNANASNPGKVVFYLADDYGNTNCSTMNTWCSTNGLTDPFIINSKSVSMSPYGAAGMPKVVIAAGQDHKVVYNKNAPDVNENDINAGINSALALATGLGAVLPGEFSVQVFPNPVTDESKLVIQVEKPGVVTVNLMNVTGQVINKVFNGNMRPGTNEYTIGKGNLENGIYFLSISEGNSFITKKVVINR
jgi:hypothetical protein